MATAVIAATVTGTLDQDDRRAMTLIVNQANARRAALNPPLDALPMSTNLELRDSYKIVQTELLNLAHADYIRQSNVATLADIRARWEAASDVQRNAALAALPVV